MRLKLSLDSCQLVITDLQKQLESLQEENSTLSTTLSTMRQSHRRALLAVEERARESEERARLAEEREKRRQVETEGEDTELE